MLTGASLPLRACFVAIGFETADNGRKTVRAHDFILPM